MTDNIAIMQGYTDEFIALAGDIDLHILVKPDTDLDDSFRAWDCDEQEFIQINGWLFTFDEIEE